jgi:hypothetical protein
VTAGARRAIGPRVGLEQLDEISRWVFQQDLLTAGALNDLATKTRARGLELRDAAIKILDEEVDAVPATGRLLLA